MIKVIAVLTAVLMPVRLGAIGAEDTTRPTPPQDPIPRERPVSAGARQEEGVVNDADQVLLERLSGLVFAPDAAGALRLQERTRSGIVVEGFPEREERRIRQIAGEFLGQPVTLAGLNRLLARLAQASLDAGFSLRRISFPAQEITSGVIAVRMGSAVVGSVKLAGRPVFGRSILRDTFRMRRGEPLDEAKVLDDMDWINRNPLRRATLVHSPGTDDDSLDLMLRVRAAKTWRAFGGIDNQLSESLGDERLYLGFQHGDVFGIDHRVTGQLTSALQREALLGASLLHQIPLPARQVMEWSAGYTQSETDVAGPIDQSGRFARFSLDHRAQLPRWMGIGHEWRSGVEFRNNDYLFPDDSSSSVRFFQIETGWEGRRLDAGGSSRGSLLAIYSPGQGVLGSEDQDFVALGADGAESLIMRLNYERFQRLGKAGSLVARVRGQWADSHLLASDQLAAGGMNGVRGFDEVVGYASSGLVGGFEWLSPRWSGGPLGDWTGVVFLDSSWLDRETAADPGELLSAGFGCRWRWKEQVSARIDIGFPLNTPETLDSEPLAHFALGLNW